ncbi:uncharacterized protein LOC128559022 [Mercenaria mercenaria]|uniref:uncharacterized protein LOC128559022 n=1 Tax=Mercenaria mercenaria TaxID=6596 RepID=UPI00234EB5BC|nr:uncharacterized protein LOC128559022 [Mercenaria mercenaria]
MEQVIVCQMRSVSQFSINVQVCNKNITAVVDTAAQVTIISDVIYKSLPNPPPIKREVKMKAAGKDMAMSGYVVGPVKLQIGSKSYTEDINVAPIEQDMLLGFDILHKDKAVLDMGKGTLSFYGMTLKLNEASLDTNEMPSIARVTVCKRQVLPPHSVAKIQCRMDLNLPDYVIEPEENIKAKFLSPKVVRSSGTKPIMCLLNTSDRYRVLKKGENIGNAYVIQDFFRSNDSGITSQVERVSQVELDPVTSETDPLKHLPNHLQQVFTESSENLEEDQKVSYAKILIEYQDVFAKNDFDLGNFTAIEHTIDTGDAKPIKQRMRKTPACFSGEEEAHLEKMLQAGVIQESTSDWASAPVLNRKSA